VHAALAEGTLPAKVREIIAVLVAHYNDCDYCLAAHSEAAKRFHFSEQEILRAFDGKANDPKIEAAVRFVDVILHTHGGIGQEEIDEVRAAGYTDGEIAEMVAVTAAQFYSNFFNRAFGTDLDYPLPLFANRQVV
jgi:AhpD family alkylhydroperoxidase